MTFGFFFHGATANIRVTPFDRPASRGGNQSQERYSLGKVRIDAQRGDWTSGCMGPNYTGGPSAAPANIRKANQRPISSGTSHHAEPPRNASPPPVLPANSCGLSHAKGRGAATPLTARTCSSSRNAEPSTSGSGASCLRCRNSKHARCPALGAAVLEWHAPTP